MIEENEMKGTTKNILLMIGSLPISGAVLLLLLEITLRVFTNPSVTPGYVQTSPERRYTLKPHFVGRTYSARCEINSLGLRDYERPVLDNAFRIVVLGDSITFGIGVEVDQTFPKILEGRLNEEFGDRFPVQVFNLGVPSYNTVQEYLYMRESYDTFRPDMILVVYCAQNDSMNVSTSHVGMNRRPMVVTIKNILRNLYSYDFLASRFYLLQYRLRARDHADEYEQRLFYDNVLYQEDYEGWINTKECFRDIKVFCDENRMSLVFAISANNYQLTKVARDDPVHPIVQKITKALKEAGIQFILVLDDGFRAYAGREDLLWVSPKDGHFSALAHALAAEEIWKHLRANRLVRK
jgi:hypothetical protein